MRPRALFVLSYAVVIGGCHVNGCWNNDFDTSPCAEDCHPSVDFGADGSIDSAPAIPHGELIATLMGEPHGLAVIDGDLYVIDGDDLVLFTPDRARVPIATGIGPAAGLVASDDALYWVASENTNGAIMRVRVAPQVGVPERVATTALPIIEGIAIDDGVRWLENSGLFLSDGDGGSILVAAANVKPTNTFSPIGHRTGSTQFIALDRLITMADDGGSIAMDIEGARAVIAAPSLTVIARSNDGGVDIDRVDNGRPPRLVLLDTTSTARALVFDGDVLLLADTNAVRMVFVTGGSRLVAATTGVPYDLAFRRGDHGNFLYFTTKNPNELQRIAY